MSDTAPFLGNPRVNQTGVSCCGKPRGCTATHDGCLFLSHPWKRAMIFDDRTVRCQATCVRPDLVTGEMVGAQCVLFHGHDGPCALELT